MYLRKQDIDWAKSWLEPSVHTLFGYVLKRNLSFGINTDAIDDAEIYAFLRRDYSKKQIEKMWKTKIEVK